MSDAGNTRIVYLVVISLLVIGSALLVFTLWFWRSTRPESPALAPLEVMGDRRFRRVEPVDQQLMLDAVRPADAVPERRVAVPSELRARSAESAIDLQQLVRETPDNFDDLAEPVERVDLGAVAASVQGHPAQRDEPAEPIEPVDAVEPADIAAQGSPDGRVESEEPAEPVDRHKSEEPAEQVDRDNSEEPAQRVEPVELGEGAVRDGADPAESLVRGDGSGAAGPVDGSVPVDPLLQRD